MYETSGIVAGSAATVSGIALLPNTGNNDLLLALSIFSIVAGCAVLGSFIFVRIAGLVQNRK